MSMIRRRIHYCHIVLLFLFSPFLCSGTGLRATLKEAVGHTTKRDITTPITTVPTIMNPNSSPDSGSTPPALTPPSTTTTANTTTGAGPGLSSWCVASQGSSRAALQVALDYACGFGGADCSAIQPGGLCYNPDTLRNHASFAFNAYYQKNPLPNSCNFGGTAVTTNTNPSTGTCQYPSTSTSSSVLNTTNSSGSTVFGAVPSRPTPPSSETSKSDIVLQHLFTVTCLVFFYLNKISQ